MPRPRKFKWDDPAESKRFIEAATTAEASNDPKDLDRAIEKIVRRKPKVRSKRNV